MPHDGRSHAERELKQPRKGIAVEQRKRGDLILLLSSRRCRQRKAGLSQAPLPGKWGPVILADTCEDCWRDWVEEQTRLINHELLLPSETEHRKVLYQKMASFLNLET